ncbi:MAG: DUF6293 family protein [Halobacteriota archaeon]
MNVHFVPVGFDYDRLIAPLVRDRVSVDRAVLLWGDVDGSDEEGHSRRLTRKLREDFESLLEAETETHEIDDVYDFESTYATAYSLIEREYHDGHDVHVNVSAMPRTVSYAFTTAAASLVAEHDDARKRIMAYYTAPERYLESEMAGSLERTQHLMRRLKDEGLTDAVERELDECYHEVVDLTREFRERGTTIGSMEFDDSHVVDIPVSTYRRVKSFEAEILRELSRLGSVDSVSELAEHLAASLDEDYTDAFRSKVIYNVRRLDEAGFVRQVEEGKSYRTELSRLGVLWTLAHEDERGKRSTSSRGDRSDEVL